MIKREMIVRTRKGKHNVRVYLNDGTSVKISMAEYLLLIESSNGRFTNTYGIEIEFLLPVTDGLFRFIDLAYEAGIRVENHMNQYRSSNYDNWHVCYDGSVRGRGCRGLELKSPVFSLDDDRGFREISVLMNILSGPQVGAKVNRTCGFHVHFGTFHGEMNSEVLGKIYQAYGTVENKFDSVVSASRRGNTNHYCGTCVGDPTHSRYRKLNVLSYDSHKTVEVRHHQGTLNADKIKNWILLCSGFLEYGNKSNWDVSELTSSNWLEILSSEAPFNPAFFSRRRAQLAN